MPAPNAQRCHNCRKPTGRVVLVPDGLAPPRPVLECADCEYLRLYGGGGKGVGYPPSMRALPLQSETLFDGLER
jgi:hypothetical protein